MSKNELLKKAKQLAAQKYTIRIVRDKTTDDDEIFLASNPELDGCMAQGETPEDAQSILKEVRIEYFAHLLEHDLPIPEPTVTITGDVERLQADPYCYSAPNIGITPGGFDDILNTAIQPTETEILLEV